MHEYMVDINPSSPKGVTTTPKQALKIVQPRDKIAPGTFKFILFLHFSEKNFEPTCTTYPQG